MVNESKLHDFHEYMRTKSIKDEFDKISDEKDGKYFCPFHIEKIPSTYVNDEQGIFKCFSCGKSGGLTKLIYYQKLENDKNITYYEAIEEYLKENPDVCAELGFSSIFDDFYRNSTLNRSELLERVKSKTRQSTDFKIVDVKIRPRNMSVEDILKDVYLKQKEIK